MKRAALLALVLVAVPVHVGGDEPPARREQLFGPDYNVAIGAQVLAWNVRTFGLERGIAVYNMWDARLTPRGQPLPNQFYVDKVLARFRGRAGMPPAGGVANNTRSTGRMPQVTPPSGDRAGLPTIRAKCRRSRSSTA